MFMLRNMQRAAKRGYAVAASAASLEVNVDAPPVRYTVVWGKPDEPDRELEPGECRARRADYFDAGYDDGRATATMMLSRASLPHRPG